MQAGGCKGSQTAKSRSVEIRCSGKVGMGRAPGGNLLWELKEEGAVLGVCQGVCLRGGLGGAMISLGVLLSHLGLVPNEALQHPAEGQGATSYRTISGAGPKESDGNCSARYQFDCLEPTTTTLRAKVGAEAMSRMVATLPR